MVDWTVHPPLCIYDGPVLYVEQYLQPIYDMLASSDITQARYGPVEDRSFFEYLAAALFDIDDYTDDLTPDPDTLFSAIQEEAQRPVVDTGNQGIQIEINWPPEYTLAAVPEAWIHLRTIGSSGTGRESSPVGGFQPQYMHQERYFHMTGSFDLTTCAKQLASP